MGKCLKHFYKKNPGWSQTFPNTSVLRQNLHEQANSSKQAEFGSGRQAFQMLPKQQPCMHSSWDTRTERLHCKVAIEGVRVYVGSAILLCLGEGYGMVAVHCHTSREDVEQPREPRLLRHVQKSCRT